MIQTLQVEGIGSVDVTLSERGSGAPVLLLHGGAGPQSVVPWAELVARTRPARVITPVHPGFMGTARPAALVDVPGLARVYAALLADLAPAGATVIGNSVGGWIAAELALLAPERVKKLVILDAAGLELPGHPIVDVFSMPFAEISKLSYHDPERFRIDPAKLAPEQRAMIAANMATLRLYAETMVDPTLAARLPGILAPTLVVWGAADRVIDVEHGRAFARAIPGARFELFAEAGHLPQLEAPEALAELVWRFMSEP